MKRVLIALLAVLTFGIVASPASADFTFDSNGAMQVPGQQIITQAQSQFTHDALIVAYNWWYNQATQGGGFPISPQDPPGGSCDAEHVWAMSENSNALAYGNQTHRNADPYTNGSGPYSNYGCDIWLNVNPTFPDGSKRDAGLNSWVYYCNVFTHEYGHNLGYSHVLTQTDIMQPASDFGLSTQSCKDLGTLYGKPGTAGSFANLYPATSIAPRDFGLTTTVANSIVSFKSPGTLEMMASKAPPANSGTVTNPVAVIPLPPANPYTITPTSWDFGPVSGNTTHDFKIKNVSGSPLAVGSGTVSGDITNFTIASGSCGVTLAPNAQCTIKIKFNGGSTNTPSNAVVSVTGASTFEVQGS